MQSGCATRVWTNWNIEVSGARINPHIKVTHAGNFQYQGIRGKNQVTMA